MSKPRGPVLLLKAEFARHRGVAASAVSKWIARGRLSAPALLPDGRIDRDLADAQLHDRLDRSKATLANRAPNRPPAPAMDPLMELRLRRERLEVERRERDAAIACGSLVDATEAARIWAAELAHVMAAIDVFVVELPAKLGLPSRDVAEQARRLWLDCRARLAAAQQLKIKIANEP